MKALWLMKKKKKKKKCAHAIAVMGFPSLVCPSVMWAVVSLRPDRESVQIMNGLRSHMAECGMLLKTEVGAVTFESDPHLSIIISKSFFFFSLYLHQRSTSSLFPSHLLHSSLQHPFSVFSLSSILPTFPLSLMLFSFVLFLPPPPLSLPLISPLSVSLLFSPFSRPCPPWYFFLVSSFPLLAGYSRRSIRHAHGGSWMTLPTCLPLLS